MDIALLYTKSQYLERRIHGIKLLFEIVKDLKYSSASSALTEQHMVEWLLKNKILEIVFNPKTYHVQIVQRSDAIIKFLIE